MGSAWVMSISDDPQDSKTTDPALFDVIDVLNGLFFLSHRSPTLDGQIPLRAAQYCIPFVEGNGAGVHLYSSGSAIKRISKKVFDFFLPDQCPLTDESYSQAILELTNSNYLSPFWSKLLAKKISWHKGHHLYVWTGLLIRPRNNVWLAVGGAYNRRENILVDELIYTDVEKFQPLLLKIDTSKIEVDNHLFEREIATILTLKPEVQISKSILQSCPDEAKNFSEFFDESYFIEKSKRPTNRYRKLISTIDPCTYQNQEFTLITMGKIRFEICKFKNFVSPEGISSKAKNGGRYEYAIVKNQFPVKLNWDGFSWISDLRLPKDFLKLVAIWESVLGKTKPPLTSLFDQSAASPPDEPLVNLLPWILIRTPKGWSSLVEGVHQNGTLEGLRGAIWTDVFHHTIAPFKVLRPGSIKVRVGTPIMRIMPIPRSYLRPNFEIQIGLKGPSGE